MIYFISDAHLGSRIIENPLAHEKKLVRWLDMVKADASQIFLMGDMLDFWFEYKTVVPKGFVRFLGKLTELADAGIEIHFFTGNHDIWTFGYLENEIGLKVHRKPETMQLGSKNFFLAHGDGLDAGDKKFHFIRRIFHSKLAQKLFGWLPPRLGQNFGYKWSEQNRKKYTGKESEYKGESNEFLVVFAKNYCKTHQPDFLIFGHRHIALDLQISKQTRVVILGDFVSIFSYGKFDGDNFSLEFFEE